METVSFFYAFATFSFFFFLIFCSSIDFFLIFKQITKSKEEIYKKQLSANNLENSQTSYL